MSMVTLVAVARVVGQIKPPTTAGTVPANPAAGLIEELTDLSKACGDQPSWVCERVYEWTGSQQWAGFAEWVFTKPATIALIVLGASLISRVLKGMITRGMQRSLRAGGTHLLRRASAGSLLVAAEPSPRLEARVETLTMVFRSLVSISVWFVAVLWILEVLEISIGPLLASAGIVGVALGFGAQTTVRDFLAGTFILLEDQLGVGDVVDLGEAKGTVEAVTLRSTRVRDVNGVLWYVPNGQIQRVANKSQQWARALIDVEIDQATPYDLAQRVIKATADAMAGEDAWAEDILGEPEVWGIEAFTAEGYQVRLVIKTRPSTQFGVLRELRIRLKAAFDEAGIRFAGDRAELWLHDGDKADALDAAETARRRRRAGGVAGHPTEPEPAPGESHPPRGDPAEAG